jgi:HPt (histidine-containing phosphotransfer) domain-containing protein
MQSESSGAAAGGKDAGNSHGEAAANRICNLRAALERLDGDADLLGMLIAVYLEDSVELETRLRGAVEKQDAATAERAAHSLKGLAANFDGLLAVDAAFTIEEAVRRQEWGVVHAALPTLEQAGAQLRRALAEHQQSR